ncbi:MAG: glycine/sarcosine/betaine reductase selenoprotein B family protein [Pyrinomonadaceae bacterium]
METIENLGEFKHRFAKWSGNESSYPFVVNKHAPFTPLRRSLPLANLALITSAGAYIDGTTPFDLDSREGNISFREIPIEIEAEDLKYSAAGYDPASIEKDRNCQIPIDRLLEYEANSVIGKVNSVWWSVAPNIANATLVAEELAPVLAERVRNSGAQVALLIPASRLCHQTLGLIAREIEQQNISTMMISVDRKLTDKVRPPRTAYYQGKIGEVAGEPLWQNYQRRILDEALRWIETFDEPGSKKLVVELETETEVARGER